MNLGSGYRTFNISLSELREAALIAVLNYTLKITELRLCLQIQNCLT